MQYTLEMVNICRQDMQDKFNLFEAVKADYAGLQILPHLHQKHTTTIYSLLYNKIQIGKRRRLCQWIAMEFKMRGIHLP
jgi:hypothetical protein